MTNNNSTMVMTGMRVQIGTQAIERAPSYLEVFGRTLQLNLSRPRWFDFPFTREEALQADKKLTIFSKSPDWCRLCGCQCQTRPSPGPLGKKDTQHHLDEAIGQ